MENPDPPGLGTLLRHLTDLLDGDLADVYASLGVDYRPRYTPVYRILLEQERATIRDIATCAGITHSAASQTVSEMVRHGLVAVRPGRDRRERLVKLTAKGRALQSKVQSQWLFTTRAAEGFDRELSASLSTLLQEAIAALQNRPFRERIALERNRPPTNQPAR